MTDTEKLSLDLEDEEQLDEEQPDDIEPVARYEAAQRELVVQPLDFNLSTLSEMVEGNAIDSNPRYQRRARWKPQRQSRLIESFLMNVPVPPIFLAEDEYGRYSVIDGQQRLKAIHGYFHKEYALTGLNVFPDLNGLKFHELPNEIRGILSMRPSLRCIIILKQSSPEIKFDVFQRLNTGGISLNAQEIRNSAFRGPLNDLILDLSEHRLLRKLLRVKNSSKSAIVQNMRDCELVLRFFALDGKWRTFSGSMGPTLNKYMERNRHADGPQLEALSARLVSTLDAVDAAFGERAYARWYDRAHKWSRGVLAAVYDAQMLACADLQVVPSTARRKQPRVVEGMQKLFTEPDFEDAIDVGTNQPSKLILRVERVRTMLMTVLG